MKSGKKSKEEVVDFLETAGIGDSVGALPLSGEMKSAVFMVRSAAKTVNRHIDRGDFHPNPKKIAALETLDGELNGVLKDEKSSLRDRAVAAGLLHAIKDIKKSVAEGSKERIGFVKSPEDASKDATGESGYDASCKEHIKHRRKDYKKTKTSSEIKEST